ncbi:MAG TPA: DegT/DnrJ/EryC1/StrS family aminotransferase, partial [bacterium]|nr:DegT/DnrJ/EryC1/StrS family aminotransferase [bacterium]
AVGVSSGTDALFLGLKALGIGPGDEVVTVPNTFLSTVAAIVTAGAVPVLVDVGDDYNLDPDLLAAAVGPRTKAIIPVHLTGRPARMKEIAEVAARHGIKILEDAAQAVDAAIDGVSTGALGDLGAFSLHPLKNLNVPGDGGVITLDDEKLRDRLLLLRNHGLKNRNESALFSFNSRLDTLKAAVADAMLKNVPEITSLRNRYAALYDEGFEDLSPFVTHPPRLPALREAFHTYVVQVERREELIEFLARRGVETKIHYPIPVHLMEASRDLGYRKGDFPVAEVQADRIVSLPVHQHLVPQQIEYVIESVRVFYR